MGSLYQVPATRRQLLHILSSPAHHSDAGAGRAQRPHDTEGNGSARAGFLGSHVLQASGLGCPLRCASLRHPGFLRHRVTAGCE